MATKYLSENLTADSPFSITKSLYRFSGEPIETTGFYENIEELENYVKNSKLSFIGQNIFLISGTNNSINTTPYFISGTNSYTKLLDEREITVEGNGTIKGNLNVYNSLLSTGTITESQTYESGIITNYTISERINDTDKELGTVYGILHLSPTVVSKNSDAKIDTISTGWITEITENGIINKKQTLNIPGGVTINDEASFESIKIDYEEDLEGNQTKGTIIDNGSIKTLGDITVGGKTDIKGTLNVENTANFDSVKILYDFEKKQGTSIDRKNGYVSYENFTLKDSSNSNYFSATSGVINITPVININNDTAASSTDGALKVTGGIKAGGAYITGATTLASTLTVSGITTILDSTEATSSDVAALIINGGVLIKKNIISDSLTANTDVKIGNLSLGKSSNVISISSNTTLNNDGKIDPDGVLSITDFDQSKILDANSSETDIGSIAILERPIGFEKDISTGTDKYEKMPYAKTADGWSALIDNYDANRIILPKNIVFTSPMGTITQEMINSEAADEVGNRVKGSYTKASAGKSIMQFLESLAGVEIAPNASTTIAPSGSITLYVKNVTKGESSSSAKTSDYYVECGSKIQVGYDTSFSDGTYPYGPEPTGVSVSSRSISGFGTTGYTAQTLSASSSTELTVTATTSYNYSGTINYTAGSNAYTNIGNTKYNTVDTYKIPAGSIPVSSRYVKGYQEGYFYGRTTAEITESNFSNLRSLLTASGAAYPTSSKVKSYTVPIGAATVIFAIPTGKSIASIQNNTNNSPMLNAFSKRENVKIKDAGGTDYETTYTVYYYTPAEPYGSTASLTITLS